MKTVVIGAGAIGGLTAGYLKSKGEDVSLVGHKESVDAIKKSGLKISGVRGNLEIQIDVCERVTQEPDLAILATKTQDLDEAFTQNKNFLKNAVILTAQNGIAADEIAVKYIPKDNIISSIVMFGATYLKPAEIVHNFEQAWVIGKIFSTNDEKVERARAVLEKIFPVIISDEIKGMKYLKLFLNSNNCLTAILGKSMQEAFSDLGISKISIGIWKEGLRVIQNCGIKLVSLPDFPLERLIKLTSLATVDAASIFCGIMTNLSKEPLYGSILQSIRRERPSEIDYINGEFVRLAKQNKSEAPLNARLTEMVHQVERTNKFFSKEELLTATQGLFN